MISLKRFLEHEKQEKQEKHEKEEEGCSTSGLVGIVAPLLEAIAQYAVEHDVEEHNVFRRQMAETIEKFERTTGDGETSIITREAIQSLQIYNRSVEKFIGNLSGEKQSVIKGMTELVVKLAGTSELAATNLRKIETDLSQACLLQDMRQLKSKMQACLEMIGQEAARQEERAKELRTPPAPRTPQDQVTGLPGLQDAEARIKELSDAKRPAYVVPMYLTNLDMVNRKAGFAAGDRILMLVGERVRPLLSGTDQIFRWRGPCFVIVIERSQKRIDVVAEAGKIAAIGLEQEIEAEGQRLLFKAAIAWTLIGVRDVAQAAEISKRIDDFAGRHSQPRPTDGQI
jgi:GGDEF domain-containing protein